VIAVASTATVVILSHRRSPASNEVPAESTRSTESASDTDVLSGQPLPLPELSKNRRSQD
jgi:hypothetical protein